MLQLTVQNGAMLMSDVPKGTAGTKSKSYLYRTNAQQKSGTYFRKFDFNFFCEFFFKFQIWTYAAAGCSADYLGP